LTCGFASPAIRHFPATFVFKVADHAQNPSLKLAENWRMAAGGWLRGIGRSMTPETPDEQTAQPQNDQPTDDATPEPMPTPEPAAVDQTDDEKALFAAAAEAVNEGVASIRSGGGVLSYSWDPEAFEPGGNFGSTPKKGSAWKLHDSAIAPLVAAARGYVTLTEEDLTAATKKYNLPRRNTTQGRRIAEALQRGEVMVMPWFTTDDIARGNRENADPVPATVQVRPTNPELNDDGKELKYEFVGGSNTPVGVHPAFPLEYVFNAPVTVIAEGLLKGDAALTGFLLDQGITPADLEWDGGTITEARARLSEILESIPTDRRVAVFTIGGVFNHRNNREWNGIDFKGRTIWVGVDGDVDTNLNVWKGTTDLWQFLEGPKKAGSVHLVALAVTEKTGETAKVGIDDYLSKYGNWGSLVAKVAPSMPRRPTDDIIEWVGKYRITEDGTALQFCEPINGDAFDPKAVTGGRWRDEYPLGGRILSTMALRTPTPKEVATGELGAGANNDEAEAFCTVEVVWQHDENRIIRAKVAGPAKILGYTPDQWERHGAHLPSSLLRCEHWPPPKKIGEEWLRAVKANQREEVTEQVRWDAMGWVPVDGAIPAFVIGNEVIGIEDLGGIEFECGITEAELSGAARFGVGKNIEGDFGDPKFEASVKRDIEEVIKTFVLGGAWTDRRIASAVVAGALRPSLPIRPAFSMFLAGPPGKGKSWTAATLMAFWSAEPGSFNGGSLPGSAKDTAAAMELAVARAPIWVIDDLAPASSRQQSEQEQEKIGNLIRNIFNGNAKRRSDANMGARKVHLPRALLVVTAENEPQVASVRQRCVSLEIGHGSLSQSTDPTNAVINLCEQDGAPARVTQALIRYLRKEAKQSEEGWKFVYETTTQMLNEAQKTAAAWMRANGGKGGDVSRHSGMAGDLTVALRWLYRLADEVGVEDDILDIIHTSEMSADVCSLVMQGHKASKESTPGRSLLEALQAALFSKKAHVLDATDASSAPGGQDNAPRLGWELGTEGRARPLGATIGYLYTDSKTGAQYVFLDQKVAFSVAQQAYPSLVPHGQSGRSSWGSVVGEGLHEDSLLRTKPDGSKMNTGRVRAGDLDISGVPIRLDVLLSGGDRNIDVV
jgi:hypothetical protein